MCRFPRVIHACGHVILITDPLDGVKLCEVAKVFGLQQDRDRAPAFCTPLNPPNDPHDLYNEDVVLEVLADDANCPDCEAVEKTPAIHKKENQDWEAANLRLAMEDIDDQIDRLLSYCDSIERNATLQVAIENLSIHPEHEWLWNMLKVRTAHRPINFYLGNYVLVGLQDAEEALEKALMRCNVDIPTTAVRYDLYAALKQTDQALNVLRRFHQIMGQLSRELHGWQDVNELCKQTELMKSVVMGPYEPPEDFQHLERGFKTPSPYRQNHAPRNADEGPSSQYRFDPSVKQTDVMAFRRPHYDGPPRYISKKKSPPPPVKIIAIPQEAAQFGKLEVHYFKEPTQGPPEAWS